MCHFDRKNARRAGERFTAALFKNGYKRAKFFKQHDAMIQKPATHRPIYVGILLLACAAAFSFTFNASRASQQRAGARREHRRVPEVPVDWAEAKLEQAAPGTDQRIDRSASRI